MSIDEIFRHFGDIFGGGGGGFEDPFSSMFGGGGGRRGRKVNQGSSLRVKVKLTLEEVAHGVEKKIKVNKYVQCDTCKGSGARGNSSFQSCPTCHGSGHVTRVTSTFLGQMQSTSTCPQCGGEGQIITEKCQDCAGNGIIKGEEVINLKIPAGVAEGMQLSVNGKGNAAARGGVPGDLIVQIEEVAHELFERDGNTLLYKHFVSIPDAAIGTSFEIPTLDSKVKIKIEPGTQSGKVLRLKGKGMPSINSWEGRGDLLVTIHVWTPKTLSKEEKAILEKLSDAPNFQPNPSAKDRSFFSKMKNMFE
jgi:molecular chaperone DnaJ